MRLASAEEIYLVVSRASIQHSSGKNRPLDAATTGAVELCEEDSPMDNPS
jgi:hypothetical protein